MYSKYERFSLQAGASKGAPNEAFERHRTSTIEEVTAATQGGGKRKVFGGGAREMHDNDVAIICERGYSAEAAGTALRNNNYNVAAALKVNRDNFADIGIGTFFIGMINLICFVDEYSYFFLIETVLCCSNYFV